MYGKALRNKFAAMGARAQVDVTEDRCEIGIVTDSDGERFDLRLPQDGSVEAKVLDLQAAERHLLLSIHDRQFNETQKFLCGHDEFHWFVAAVPDNSEPGKVEEAMEALKPRAVRDEQERRRVKRRHRTRRRTAAYIRQGEWYFVPEPDVVVPPKEVQHNGVLVRGRGKPHQVQWLYRQKGPEAKTYARGRVTHEDHSTVKLDEWHRVMVNTESRAMTRKRRARQAKPATRPRVTMDYVD